MSKNKNRSIIKGKVIDSNFVLAALGSLFAACMLFMNMKRHIYERRNTAGGFNYIYECIENVSSSLDNVFFQITVVSVLFILLSRKIASLGIKRLRFARIFSMFTAIMWTIGKAFSIENDLNLLVCSGGQIVKSVILFWGSYYFVDNLIHLFWYFLEKRPDLKIGENCLKNRKYGIVARVLNFWNKHPFTFPFVFLIAVWTPYLIVSYPGVMYADAYTELLQYYGMMKFTSHHPPLCTLLIGIFVDMGKSLFGSPEVGVFIYLIFQYIVCAAAMAYVLTVMKKLNAPIWLNVVSIFTFGFMPIYIAFVSLTVKDILYCMAFVVFLVQIILLLTQKEKFRTPRNIILTVISAALTILLRNNGKYAVYPLIAVLAIKFIADFVKKRISVKYLCGGIAMLIVPIILSSGITILMTNAYNIAPGSIREALSIPFQQTARYVRDYGDEVTEDEREAIDAILDYDNLGKLYDEIISDPVKKTYKPETLNDDAKEKLINYFKVWFAQFKKHPICYFEATLNQNYFIFYPFDETSRIYYQTEVTNEHDKKRFEKLGIKEFEPLTNIQQVFTDLYKLTTHLPFLSLLNSNAFYTLIMLCILIYAINKKRNEILVISIPLIMTLLVIIASPVIASHPRYAFPISYSIPLLLSYYLYATDNRNKDGINDSSIQKSDFTEPKIKENIRG